MISLSIYFYAFVGGQACLRETVLTRTLVNFACVRRLTRCNWRSFLVNFLYIESWALWVAQLKVFVCRKSINTELIGWKESNEALEINYLAIFVNNLWEASKSLSARNCFLILKILRLTSQFPTTSSKFSLLTHEKLFISSQVDVNVTGFCVTI